MPIRTKGLDKTRGRPQPTQDTGLQRVSGKQSGAALCGLETTVQSPLSRPMCLWTLLAKRGPHRRHYVTDREDVRYDGSVAPNCTKTRE